MPSPIKFTVFARYALLAVVLLALGAVTLLIGVGAGRAAAGYFLSAEAEVPPGEAPAVWVEYEQVTLPIGCAEVDFTDGIEAIRHAVVSITVYAAGFAGVLPAPEQPLVPSGSGSGFIFYKDNTFAYIATNNHVVENTDAIYVSLDDETTLRARFVGAAADNDLAVLTVPLVRLEESGKPFSVAVLGSSAALRRGDSVAALGNALGGGQRITQGIVSALDVEIRVPNPATGTALYLNVMQTDAAVNRGNSGGPMINQYGEVVGIITAKFMGQGVEGMGYVLPIDDIYTLLRRLREEGSVVVPFMGISYNEITEALRQLYNLPAVGQWITRVMPGTPAYYAGLLRGDLIVRFGDVEITSFAVFREALIAGGVGETVTLGILRNGEPMDIDITLGAPR